MRGHAQRKRRSLVIPTSSRNRNSRIRHLRRSPARQIQCHTPSPGAFTLFAVQLPVIPAGNAEFENVIAELNPATAVVVIVKLPFAPGASETVAGLTAKVNPETFTVTVAVRTTPPPLALIVSV